MTGSEPLVGRIGEAVGAIRARCGLRPRVALVLGTGLGGVAERIDVSAAIDYREIPGFAASTVESHSGRLLLGRLSGVPVVAMQGRFHAYEGYTLREVTFPVRVMRELGAEVLVVSNASGGMNRYWRAGDLMLIADHINLLGDNPLVGPNEDALGPRFPDLSAVYDGELRAIAREVALERGIALREGVYAAVLGPNLETRAEYRMLHDLGADVVGMSTVPEAIVAVHGGMRVMGISIVTDECVPETLEPASLEKILAVARASEPRLTELVEAVVGRI